MNETSKPTFPPTPSITRSEAFRLIDDMGQILRNHRLLVDPSWMPAAGSGTIKLDDNLKERLTGELSETASKLKQATDFAVDTDDRRLGEALLLLREDAMALLKCWEKVGMGYFQNLAAILGNIRFARVFFRLRRGEQEQTAEAYGEKSGEGEAGEPVAASDGQTGEAGTPVAASNEQTDEDKENMLPDELNTNECRKLLSAMIEAGLCECKRGRYVWKRSKALLAYVADRASEGRPAGLGLGEKEKADGTTYANFKPWEFLFSRQNLRGAKGGYKASIGTPKGYEIVDKVFEQCGFKKCRTLH